MICATITTVFAESVFSEDGYLYTYINNEKVTLYSVEGINDVVVPATLNGRAVVEIRNYAFMNNAEITSVDFGSAEKLERIGSFAFFNCENIDGEIMIPSNVLTVDTAAFQGCTSLDSVVFNASTGIVPNQCFSGCTSLNSVTLNDTVKRIGYYAFSNCPNLTYIEIPASVTDIAISAFQSDTAITLGVYTDSFAHQYAVANDISFVLLDAPAPTEPPTEPETEPVTEAPTEPVTEAPTEPATELLGYILGDVDNNGVVESIDATWIQRYSVQMELPIPEENMVQGDVDGDGETNVYDVTFIQRYVVDILTPYDIGKFIAL